jgi:D-glycero-alpha-D-manno-heptose 1-phosphate guanylyltransferase
MVESPASKHRPPPPRGVPVFVLCGGLGTRLGSVESRPKAVIQVAGMPFLGYPLRLLRIQGFRRVHLLLGHGAEQVRSAFSGPGIEYSLEQEPLGTGGALGLVRERAARMNLILNGDSYAESHYPDLLTSHAQRGAAAEAGVTLLALRVDDRGDYGGLTVDEEGRVVSFQEKGSPGPGWINAGVYAAGRAFFLDLPPGRCSLEQEVLPRLAGRGLLFAETGRFFFRDIGTPARLRSAQQEFRWIRHRIEDEAGVPSAEEWNRILEEG